MSNIVLKGDIIQNLGEYLPNPYIERVDVLQTESRYLTLTIYCSVLILVPDNYVVQDVIRTIKETNMYATIQSSPGKQIKKQAIVEKISSGMIKESEIYLLDSGEGIASIIGDGDYQDDLYDEQDRRIFKANFSSTIELEIEENIARENVYIYIFSSILAKNELYKNNSSFLYLNTSNFAYEKLFSSGLTILREEEVIYVDNQGNKYGQIPILSLDRNFYKTDRISRKFIIDKFNSLIRRFQGRTIGPLTDSVNSIKSVLSVEASTENLLVKLDKVRKSFPNKTNNNPLGNLYASFSKLLINTNSAFLPSEIVTKQKYVTGKVRYIEQGYIPQYAELSAPQGIDYIPEKMFLAHRERLSSDEVYDFALNRGVFFVRLEEWLKIESEIATTIDMTKLYEIVTGPQLNNLRRILLSYFRVTNIEIIKYHKTGISTKDKMQTTSLSYGTAQSSNYRLAAPELKIDIPNLESATALGVAEVPYNATEDEVQELGASEDGLYLIATFLKEYNFGFTSPMERLLCYSFQDIDSFTGIYEADQLEKNGGITFEYEININIRDQTRQFVRFLVNKFRQLTIDFKTYRDFANETCSYNNIDNRFNDFFINSLKDYNFRYSRFPWQDAPAFYSVMIYLFTNDFSTFENSTRFSKNLSSLISPENVDLRSLDNFLQLMENMNLVLNQINSSFGAIQIDGVDLETSMTTEVTLTPINFNRVLDEAEAESAQVSDEPESSPPTTGGGFIPDSGPGTIDRGREFELDRERFSPLSKKGADGDEETQDENQSGSSGSTATSPGSDSDKGVDLVV